jgi:hypothetical protein
MKNTNFTRKGPGRKHPTMTKKQYKELQKTKFEAKLKAASLQGETK